MTHVPTLVALAMLLAVLALLFAEPMTREAPVHRRTAHDAKLQMLCVSPDGQAVLRMTDREQRGCIK